MYYNHNLRTSLQEWKNRLYRAPYKEFGNQLKYFISNLDGQKLLSSILTESCIQYAVEDSQIEEFITQAEHGSVRWSGLAGHFLC